MTDIRRLVVVTPIYEDVEASSRLLHELALLPFNVHVIAVDDGSVKQPVRVEMLEKARIQGVVLKLCRNVGHQRAIAIGLSYASSLITIGDAVVVMDSDGEDLPGSIATLIKGFGINDYDVIAAERRSRVETWKFKAFYLVYKSLFKLLTGRSISFGNFMVLKPTAVKRLVSMQELSIHVAGAVLVSKLRTMRCPIDRGPRYAGQSKMNFVGLALHGFKGLMVFAEDVLVRVGIVCAAIAVLAGGGVLLAISLKVLGFATPGWFSVALGILTLMVLQTGALALMTLMLTGVVRSGAVVTSLSYSDFVEEVIQSTVDKGR